MKPSSEQRRIAASSISVVLFLGMLIFASSLGVPKSSSPVPIIGITHMAHPPIDTVALMKAVNPSDGIMLPIIYGQAGPKLVETGTIDLSLLQRASQKNGKILSDQELEILTRGSQKSILVTQQNAAFLLQLFWAIGLTNQNPILEQGPIRANGVILEEISSIRGWKLSQKSAIELFSKGKIVSLSPDQQLRVEEVAKAVYLPCCNNPALFPDCNHGMAMLGLLELMGSQDASVDEMFTAAKQVSAFWYPEQTLEIAIFMIATQLKDYSYIDARTILSADYSSARGFQQINQWLAKNGMLKDEIEISPVCTE